MRKILKFLGLWTVLMGEHVFTWAIAEEDCGAESREALDQIAEDKDLLTSKSVYTFKDPEQRRLWEIENPLHILLDPTSDHPIAMKVTSILRRFAKHYSIRNPQYDYKDYYQTGVLKIIDIWNWFDPSLGVQFNTPAHTAVKDAMRKLSKRTPMRIGPETSDRYVFLERVKDLHLTQKGEPPTFEEFRRLVYQEINRSIEDFIKERKRKGEKKSPTVKEALEGNYLSKIDEDLIREFYLSGTPHTSGDSITHIMEDSDSRIATLWDPVELESNNSAKLLKDKIVTFLKGVKEKDRLIFELHIFSGLSLPDIGTLLGMSRKGTWASFNKTRDQLVKMYPELKVYLKEKNDAPKE